jgi:aminopeptidase N
VPSYQLKNSGINSYTVGSYSYYSLYRLLGKEEFKKCLKAYMDTWKYKHPTPYDFMFTFNTTSGKDLNWFWKSWYFDWGYMDVGIKEFKNNVLTIENAGGKPIAFNIRTTYSDGTSMTEEINPSVWKASSALTKKLDGKKTVTLIELQIPTNGDAVKDNNTWKLKTN